jgi:arsenite methyltransferase
MLFVLSLQPSSRIPNIQSLISNTQSGEPCSGLTESSFCRYNGGTDELAEVRSMDTISSSRQSPAIPTRIWQMGGLTEHLGGLDATQRLLEQCRLTPGLWVLDIGCGTGHTASQLARKYGAHVVALDLNSRSVAEARTRLVHDGKQAQVCLVQADAHALPFRSNTFDTAMVESVLIFCDAATAALEIHRALKPGGMFGANELTLLKPPPPELTSLLVGSLGIHAYAQGEWEAIFRRAGLANVTSSVFKIDFREQLRSHIRTDGIRNYLTGMVAGVKDTAIRSTFFNRKMLRAFREFLPYVGYGLYVAQKAS